MLIEQLSAGAASAVILVAPAVSGVTLFDEMAEATPEVAAPFSHRQSFKVFERDIQTFAMRQEYLEGSTALNIPVSFSVEENDPTTNTTPAELVHELRQISGLTWAQIAEVFDVSSRAPYHWASGKTVSAENHERLGQVVTALRFIDRGSAEENRNLLLSNARPGQTFLDLLCSGECELVRTLAGEGVGRPNLGPALTRDAERFNAPRHWGDAIEASSGIDETEILPLSQPKLRRAKARRNKV
ncbi:hypothetical protein [Rhodovulum sulfidophilum]|uniref:hypothetical protein n=1 Tax=Rhodovulum sulfidophilum TaxID=35806 RepID=UPI001924D0F0|nr:hypothetical protein [Rhodovulum sulfidophilum]MBL3562227.1 hypothetical protein [Rhodovulum sulfidophilum]